MAAKVFISYRRDDSAGHAGRLHDRLEREFGADLLFMDVDSIPLGRNFVKVLGEKVAQCDVLLAVIGPNWLTLCDEQGNRRLDGANDFVRVEIASALQRDIPVIPVLLDGARIPKAEQLPPDLKELSLRNSLDVRHASFHSDMDKLIKGLKESSAPDPALSAGAPVQSIAQTTASANMRLPRTQAYRKERRLRPKSAFNPEVPNSSNTWFLEDLSRRLARLVFGSLSNGRLRSQIDPSPSPRRSRFWSHRRRQKRRL
jgi:hypothetical protein